MITRYLIDCGLKSCKTVLPLMIPCGSARTMGVTGLPSDATGCSIRITNADGTMLTKACVKSGREWVATFPASHFQNYGDVKNGIVVYATGKDETNVVQTWIVRVIDLRITAIAASSRAGTAMQNGGEVYHKSEVVGGIQHFKKEILTYSQRQNAWGAEYVGDYVIVGGEFVQFTTGG